MSANDTIITDVVATQPPKAAVEDQARRTSIIAEKASLSGDKETGHDIVSVESQDQHWDYEAYPIPTEEEKQTLRRVYGTIPWIAWLLCVVEFAERASYYGASQVFSNFIQFELPKGGNGAGAPPPGTEETAGALGKGLQFANAFVLLFKFLAYTAPIFGAWIADAKIGRYPAILIGVLICGLAHIIMIVGAIPSVLQAGHGTAPFIISLLILAIGAGIFKPNILPTLLDQYRHQKEYVKTEKSGERVIVDPELTISRLSLIFYGVVNIGAFFGIATTYAEKRVGYWLAFLVPGIVYFLLPLVLLLTYKRTYRVKPQGSELTNVFQIIACAIKENKGKPWAKGYWSAAKPSVLAAKGVTTWRGKPIAWNDKLVEEVRRTIAACGLFLYFPLWYLNDGGIGSVANSQGSTMTTAGTPNDLLQNFNPLSIIIAIPILTYGIYPLLKRLGINFGRISRITFGFTLAWISGVVGAILQWHIYRTSPCGYYATDCDIGTGVTDLSIWAQTPVWVLGAVSECFCQVTAYEIAYARSPKNMKALVMSMFLFMNALSSALAEILTPAIKDPHLIWVWAGPAIALFVQTCVFWWRYRWMNNDEYMLEDDATTLPPSDTKSGLEPTDSEPRGHPEKKNEL